MSTPLQTDSSRTRLHLLAAILFVSYLCVAIPLPVIPVFVTHRLGLDNVWAGLGVGIAFLSTIFTRGYAGNLVDRLGAKTAVVRGMLLYAGGAAISLLAGFAGAPWAAFGTLVLGRLLLGLGESLVGVGIITWGVGFSGTMAVSALLPCIGLAVVAGLAGIAPHPHGKRPSFASVVGRLWLHGLVVCLQGIGFAAIGAFFALDFLHNGWHYAGLGLTAFGVGFVLVRVLFGHLPDRVGGLPVAIGSLAVETVGQLMIWSANDPGLALAGAFLTGLGCSMVFPAMGREVVHLVAPHLRGAAMGAYAAFQDLAYGLTGPVAGMLADRSGYGGVFLAGGVAALIGMLVVLYLQRVRAPVAQ